MRLVRIRTGTLTNRQQGHACLYGPLTFLAPYIANPVVESSRIAPLYCDNGDWDIAVSRARLQLLAVYRDNKNGAIGC
jgi:hypothetical protein